MAAVVSLENWILNTNTIWKNNKKQPKEDTVYNVISSTINLLYIEKLQETFNKLINDKMLTIRLHNEIQRIFIKFS